MGNNGNYEALEIMMLVLIETLVKTETIAGHHLSKSLRKEIVKLENASETLIEKLEKMEKLISAFSVQETVCSSR